jgi:hypothetical protein
MNIGELHPHSEINFPPRRKRGHVPDWSPRKSISQLIAERDWTSAIPNQTPKDRFEAMAASNALAEGRWRAAVEFGVPHAWRPTCRGFNLEEVCGFHNNRRRYREIRTQPHEMFDHKMHFRWERGRAPAAIVAQPYTPAFNLAEAEEFARQNELVVHVADAFESWYSPGNCTIVVWTQGAPEGNGVGHGCWMTPR